jgi:hypothetical protein
MAGKAPEKRPPTVVVAADVCSYSTPVVNLAVEIAASAGSALRGVFVEDEDLLVLTGLPLAREISLTTASARPTSVDRMQRTLRSISRQFEATLQREAQASKIAWSYEYVRGRIQDFGLRPKLDADYTILGRAGLYRVEPAPRARTRKLLLIANQSLQQLQALSVVLRRFARDRVELTLVGDHEFARSLQQLPAELLADVEVIASDRNEVLDRLRKSAMAFDYAILSLHQGADELASILKALQCPVILVA